MPTSFITETLACETKSPAAKLVELLIVIVVQLLPAETLLENTVSPVHTFNW
jgi:hypothetical protein